MSYVIVVLVGLVGYMCLVSRLSSRLPVGARCSTIVRAFANGAMGRGIDSSWGGHIELFLVPASAQRLV